MPRVEAWLRGPVADVPALLQPVAHALIEAAEDAEGVVADLSTAELWARIEGATPVGFHLRHMAGSLDRLLTYARGEQLEDAQRDALAREKEHTPQLDASTLLAALRTAVEAALAQLRSTDPATLLEPRAVGRARAPSTVLGLLFHAAEHTARHAGQVSSTARIVVGGRRTG